jgi:hypothetical protein
MLSGHIFKIGCINQVDVEPNGSISSEHARTVLELNELTSDMLALHLCEMVPLFNKDDNGVDAAVPWGFDATELADLQKQFKEWCTADAMRKQSSAKEGYIVWLKYAPSLLRPKRLLASSSELAQSGARNMVSAATRLLGFVDTGRVIHDKSLTNYDSSCFEGNTLTSNDIRWLHHIKTIGAAGILRGELYDRKFFTAACDEIDFCVLDTFRERCCN